jgi:hypothetical protein
MLLVGASGAVRLGRGVRRRLHADDGDRGSHFAGAELVGIYAAMWLVWGVGALLGPALAGVAIDLSAHGLPIFAALACLAFTVFATTSRSAA